MDSILQFLPSPMVSLVVISLIFYFLTMGKRRNSTKTGKKAPGAQGAWPIIGHLHLLRGPELPHKTLAAMADKYGPLFMIRMGLHRAVVVSSWEVAKECYTTNDKAFASRPSFIAAEIMAYNSVMFGSAPYGPYWREMRKIIMSELLSTRRLELLKHIQDTEIDTSIKELYQVWVNHSKNNSPVLVEMKQWFGDLTLNIILRMVVGKRYFGTTSTCDKMEATRCTNAMRDFMRLMGIFIVEDAVPYLRWLDLQGYKKEMKHTAKELDSLAQGWLEEHKKRQLCGETNGEQDFMDVLMSEHINLSYYDKDTTIKATCMSIITGGSDTTTVTLTWILSLLLNNQHALRKAQEELDNQVGRDREVNDSDIKNLVYLQAVIKESLRLYPAGPLSGPRIAAEDCILAGYHVPAGTRLIVNLWKIQQDPLVWPDPSEFRPERFLVDHVEKDVKGQHFEIIPFGTGRRSCPGTSFALQVMLSILAHLLHKFEITTQNDMPVNMTESAGMTNIKATPLEVVLNPRLCPKLYGL